MRFAVLVKANKDSKAGVLPSSEMPEKMGKFNEQGCPQEPFRSSLSALRRRRVYRWSLCSRPYGFQ
jgi:hypothetical protein